MSSTVERSNLLDTDDIRLIRALQLAPRAGFARFAEVLGLSEATVARRFRRLRRTGVLQVVGVVDTEALGQNTWILRARCRPDSAEAVAEALAGRDDVSWVSVNSGGSEVTASIRSWSQADRDQLVVEMLPRVRAISDISTMVVMQVFTRGCQRDWTSLETALTADESSALTVDDPVERERRSVRLAPEGHDETILAALTVDGRASNVDLAQAAGITPARAARRLQALLDGGVVHFDVELSRAALGYTTRADLWLQVDPARLRGVGAELAMMSEVAFAGAVSGTHNIYAAVNCRNLDELFGLVSDRVGVLDGVRAVEVSPAARQIKQFNSVMDGELLGRSSRPAGRAAGRA